VLVVVFLRPLVQPRQAWLNGRLMQGHFRLEAEAAQTAFYRELGLERRFPPPRFKPRSAQMPGDLAPTWLGLADSRESGSDTATWVWLERDGSILLPPLANRIRESHRWNSLPERVRVTGRDGRRMVGAICAQGGPSSAGTEWTIWLHRGDRWVNSLRLKVTARNVGDLVPRPHWNRVDVVLLERLPEASFRWNAAAATFERAAPLPNGVERIAPLPDQTGEP
jgi:hypothetical protein